MDTLDIVVGERSIGATDQAGTYGGLFGPLGALGNAGGAPTARLASDGAPA